MTQTSQAGRFGELWQYDAENGRIVDAEDTTVFYAEDTLHRDHDRLSRRIVACVNALDFLPTEAITSGAIVELIGAAQAVVTRHGTDDHEVARLHRAVQIALGISDPAASRKD